MRTTLHRGVSIGFLALTMLMSGCIVNRTKADGRGYEHVHDHYSLSVRPFNCRSGDDDEYNCFYVVLRTKDQNLFALNSFNFDWIQSTYRKGSGDFGAPTFIVIEPPYQRDDFINVKIVPLELYPSGQLPAQWKDGLKFLGRTRHSLTIKYTVQGAPVEDAFEFEIYAGTHTYSGCHWVC